MPTYYMCISSFEDTEIEIEARDAHDALNSGVNALAQFACNIFPPPENVSIAVKDPSRQLIANVEYTFVITYSPDFKL